MYTRFIRDNVIRHQDVFFPGGHGSVEHVLSHDTSCSFKEVPVLLGGSSEQCMLLLGFSKLFWNLPGTYILPSEDTHTRNLPFHQW